jgi:DNA-binding NarL/FixJ family response regulator
MTLVCLLQDFFNLLPFRKYFLVITRRLPIARSRSRCINSSDIGKEPHSMSAQSQPSERVIRVALLAEDRITRTGLRFLIDRESGMTVVGEHELMDDPGAMLAAAHPHVMLLDVDRGSRDFVPELITRLSRKTSVIVLTSSADAGMVSNAFWSGARGLVRKNETPALLLKAIRKVDAGEVWLDRSTMSRLLGELSRGGKAGATDPPRVGRLTLRERQLITIVGQGSGNGEIAERLRISEATVRNHLTSIFRKLELHSRFELVMYALRQGLIEAPIPRPRPARATSRATSRAKSAS